MSENRICFHAQQALGDLVCAAAAAASVKAKHPELVLYWCLEAEHLQTLFKNLPEIEGVVQHADEVDARPIDIHPFSFPGVKDEAFWNLHLMEKIYRTAEYHFGPLPRRERPYYQVSGEDIDEVNSFGLPERFYSIHSITSTRNPGDPRFDRNWPMERFNDLIRRLDAPAVQIGSPDDPLIEGAIHQTGLPIHLSAAIIARSAAFIGLESGPSYIADALDMPCVILHPRSVSGSPESCGPLKTTCTRIVCGRVDEVSVHQVLEGVYDAQRRHGTLTRGPIIWEAQEPPRPRRRLRLRWRRRRRWVRVRIRGRWRWRRVTRYGVRRIRRRGWRVRRLRLRRRRRAA